MVKKNILKVVDLVKTYGEGSLKTPAVKGISFEIKEGEFIALSGPSGSGKSTTFHQIALLDVPTSGKIEIDGVSISSLDEEEKTRFRLEKIGYVFQNYALLPELTALENTYLPMICENGITKEIIEKARKILIGLGLKDRENHYPSELSGGEQQRVSIARAMIKEPRIILADEPTANLDSVSGKNVMKILKNLSREKNMSVFVVNHETEFDNYFDRVIRMKDGLIDNSKAEGNLKQKVIKTKKGENIKEDIKNKMKTKFAIVISKLDKAGMNIAKHLDKFGVAYNLIEQDSIDFEQDDFDKYKNGILNNYDFIIFATKHRSAKGNRSLTCHAPGNWKKADFGGEEGKICKTSAFFMKYLFLVLNDEAKKQSWEYEISMECTHHGPSIEKPCCFIEIGSDEKDWMDEKAGNIIATVIKRAINNYSVFSEENWIPAIAIGGPHYCPNFNKIQLNSHIAIGHVIPSYVFPVTREMIDGAIEKNIEKIQKAVIDWKGCGKSAEREDIIRLCEDAGLDVIRGDKIRK